jgi:hypothetical protein
MDFDRIKSAFAVIGLILCLAIVFIAGRKSVNIPDVKTEFIRDTIRIDNPVLVTRDSVRVEYVYIKLEPDTVFVDRETVVTKTDSVKVPVNFERRTYGDDRYRAVVSGAAIGDMHPSLESIDIYSKTETKIVQYKAPTFRPYIRGSIGKEAIGIGGGVSIKDRVDIDAQYMRFRNDNMVVFGVNYRFNIKSK